MPAQESTATGASRAQSLGFGFRDISLWKGSPAFRHEATAILSGRAIVQDQRL